MTQHLDYSLLTERELQQYLIWTQQAATACQQMASAIQRAAQDYAAISDAMQEHVAQIAHFRAERKRRNERTTKLLTELPDTGCPLDDCSGELIGQDREEDERYAEMMGRSFEIRCTACGAAVYPPPAMSLWQHGAEYLRAGQELLRSTKPHSVRGLYIKVPQIAMFVRLSPCIIGDVTDYDFPPVSTASVPALKILAESMSLEGIRERIADDYDAHQRRRHTLIASDDDRAEAGEEDPQQIAQVHAKRPRSPSR